MIDKKLSTYEIAGILQCSQHTVMRRMKNLGLKSKHSRMKPHSKFCKNCGKSIVYKNNGHHNIYCNTTCQKDMEYKQYIIKWLNKEVSGNTRSAISDNVRKWLFEKSAYKCEKCGWDKINESTHKCPLTVHHKDGNNKNTVPENIEALCPNCHSLTSTYGGLNKGHGRRNRYTKNKRE